MNDDIIRLERKGAIATLIINNPDKRNAMNLAAWRRLGEVTAELEADDDLRCVLVTGMGDHFAAGADISEFPTIAVIRGACTGGGFEIACCCDMRLAAEGARFGIPINRLGHAFAYPEMAAALAVVPAAVIMELLLEGRILETDEAYAKGLLTRVVPADQLDDEAETVAWRVAQGAPLAARGSKKILRHLLRPAQISPEELKSSYALCDSEDYKEGVRAFLAKEKPAFKAR